MAQPIPKFKSALRLGMEYTKDINNLIFIYSEAGKAHRQTHHLTLLLEYRTP
jgi:hypothetical protein